MWQNWSMNNIKEVMMMQKRDRASIQKRLFRVLQARIADVSAHIEVFFSIFLFIYLIFLYFVCFVYLFICLFVADDESNIKCGKDTKASRQTTNSQR